MSKGARVGEYSGLASSELPEEGASLISLRLLGEKPRITDFCGLPPGHCGSSEQPKEFWST